jgi:putative radical SAM enzyme (TIGR03279 family)
LEYNKIMSLTIQVENESIAADKGLKSGDKIRKINGQEIKDQIDFSFHSSEEYLDLEVERPDGSVLYPSIQRIYNQSLGISVIPPEITQCDNACVFCFIHQQPKGMRKSLYVMDDDYRYSFSDGNFITLTNLKPQEWKRIYQLKLSPLYISVHATEPAVRQKMVKHSSAGKIMENLRKLMRHDISFHAQVVLCHGYNDKEHLDRTIADLVKLRPYMRGIAVVPAGLTHFRKNLPYLKPWDDEMAMVTIKQVEKWQKYFRQKYGETIVYLGDEFYYLAGKKIPAAPHYDGFYFVEDGIGTTRYFYHVFNRHKKHLPVSIEKPKTATVICGVIAEKYLREAVGRMNEIKDLNIKLVPIKNNYFGKGITVTGLITATDLIYALRDQEIGDELIIPSVVLRKEDQLFLDNYTVPEVEAALKTRIRICEMGAANFIAACLFQ